MTDTGKPSALMAAAERDYAETRESFGLDVPPWEALTQEQRDRMVAEYVRHRNWMDDLGQAITRAAQSRKSTGGDK